MNKDIDIVRMIEKHSNIKLIKVSDGLYRNYCPFCNDDIPSLFIDTDIQEYHCFSCGRLGNVTNFIMETYKTDFHGAVKIISGKKTDDTVNKLKRELDPYYKMNIDAANYFHNKLYSEEGKKGLEYFKNERGLTDDIIRKFGLGYASNSGLYKSLKKDYPADKIVENGLARKSNKNTYDFFYNRVIIPILDMNSKVIGFGGRVLDDSKPKYINSGKTPVFDKRVNLFALNLAKNSKRDGLILCEGYMDVISLFMYGFDNAVASLGTALTEEHVYLISRFTNHVYIAYDGDDAGQGATDDALNILKKYGIIVKRIENPGAKDPDEFIRKFGAEAYQYQINNARYL